MGGNLVGQAMNSSSSPSPGELDKLAATFRANPRSTVFVPLAQGYLAAARPDEAIDVLLRGLATYPDHTEGRLTLGRAYAAVERWKEAELELVKVVKQDRYHQKGFALLGEVLLHRHNFEVAAKALQRAHDLDPTDGTVRSLLERARARRPLDDGAAAAAIAAAEAAAASAPQAARLDAAVPGLAYGSTMPPPAGKQDFQDDAPTTVNPRQVQAVTRDVPIGDGASLDPGPPLEDDSAVRSSRRRMQLVPPVPAPRGEPAPLGPPPAFAEADEAATVRAAALPWEPSWQPAVEPVPEVPAAADDVEPFLNLVLEAGGPVPEDPPLPDDGVPAVRWGHRFQRPFLYLWLGLLAGTAAGAFVYFQDKHDRKVAIASHLEKARARLLLGQPADFTAADDEATQAIKIDPANVEAVADLAAARTMAVLIYGDGQLNDAEDSLIAADIRYRSPNTEKGNAQRELAVANAAFALAAVARGRDSAADFPKVRLTLDRALKIWPDDHLLLWVDGLVRLATGDRGGARAELSRAAPDVAAAAIALADMDLDERLYGAAAERYQQTLQRLVSEPMARAGKSLALAENPATAKQDLEVARAVLEPTLARVAGKRVEAFTRLALAELAARLGEADQAREQVVAAIATGDAEPRFLARVALLLVDQGKVQDAYVQRTRVRGKSADPMIPTVDAELYLAGGRPDEALKLVAAPAPDDLRGNLLAGRAHLDAGTAMVAPFEAAAKLAPADAVVKAQLELARVAADPAHQTGTAALAKLVGTSPTPLLSGILGEAHLAAGETAAAQARLEAATMGENPRGYRAQAALAELYLARQKIDDAETIARAALQAAPGYLPAHAALGRALVAAGKQAEAGPELELVVSAGRARAADEVAYAEAALAAGKPDLAKEALRRAKDKGAAQADLARVSALVDPALPGQLAAPGGAVGSAPRGSAPAPPVPRKKR
jgi:tetratricopeptide (TPR) repeat protein